MRSISVKDFSLRVLRAHHRVQPVSRSIRRFSTTTYLCDDKQPGASEPSSGDGTTRKSVSTVAPSSGEEEGALSRRLLDMTEQSLSDAGIRAGKALAEAGFSEELRQKLEERIQSSSFKSEHSAAFAQASMPLFAGQGSRRIAAAEPWTGTEDQGDAVLRMLTDTHKPLRGMRARAPPPRTPVKVDMQPQVAPLGSGQRLASARDRSSIYAMTNDPNLSHGEREQMRKELKERFSPGARPMPNSLQGLAALANERIDDAIARGQFKNLPRGKAIARDYNASSPFLDTTEYFMNKIIQKQQIVPPWIEKQQELARAVNTFRDRLRSDWKRHAARTIASGGGTLQAQISRAAGYAAAERRLAPAARKRPAEVEEERGISQADHSVTVAAGAAITPPMTGPSPYPLSPLPPPFRDPAWEESERSYQALSISNINTLTRSYNLMAPDMAKKPYFTLERELRACYADVAPQLVNEIHERARAPVIQVEKVDHRPGGMLEKFGGHKAQVYDSRKPKYGFREFLRDLWRSSKAAGG